MKKFVETIITLIVIWVLAIVALWVLEQFGPVAAIVKITDPGAYILAGGALAAFIILVVLMVWAFTKIADKIGLGRAAEAIMNTFQTFFGP